MTICYRFSALAVFLTLCAPSVTAQHTIPYTDYLPLAEGYRWEYSQNVFGTPGTRYVFREVTGDTLIDGQSYYLIEEQQTTTGGEPLANGRCALRVEDDSFDRVVLDDPCFEPIEGPWFPDAEYLDRVVTVGGIEYEVDGELEYFSKYPGDGGTFFVNIRRVASGIGPISELDEGPSGSQSESLRYAEVGTLYGTPIVFDDEVSFRRFYPLAVGDTWVYESCNTFDPENPCTEVSLSRRTVVGDTLIGGVEHALVETTSGLDGENPQRCAERLSETGEIVWLGGPNCRPPAALGLNLRDPGPAAVATYGPEVDIGGETYEPDSLVWFVDWEQGTYEHDVLFASDIGFVSDSYDFMGPGDVGYVELRYAEVGGETYGSLPTASEGDGAVSAFTLGAAYPNPFRASTTLMLRLATTGTVTVEVFDVLGRRVLERSLGVQPAGQQPVRLDLGAVPVGVYFARATTASGQQATRRIVRVE